MPHHAREEAAASRNMVEETLGGWGGRGEGKDGRGEGGRDGGRREGRRLEQEEREEGVRLSRLPSLFPGHPKCCPKDS